MTLYRPIACVLSHPRRRNLFLPAFLIILILFTGAVPAVAADPVPETETILFDVPPGELDACLNAFAVQAALTLSFDPALVAGMTCNGLKGTYTRSAALAHLLSGTGLSPETAAENAVILGPDRDLDTGLPAAADNPMAAKAGTDTETRQDGYTVEVAEITIWGEKVPRSYLDTVTSVGLSTGEDIETYSIGSLYDSFNHMGNVRFFPNNGGNNSLQIRGLSADGITDIANASPLISVIIDGAAQNSEGLRRGARGTWDLKQIEVLRGPQSGLHGRTALGGAVIIESKDPTYHWEGALKGGLAEMDHKDGAVMLSGPLVDNQIAFRISGETRDEVKDISFTDPGNEFLGEDEYRNLRGKLLFEPLALPGFKALFTANSSHDMPATTTVSGPDFFERVYDSTSNYTEKRETDVSNYIANLSYALSDKFKIRSVSSRIITDMEINSAPASTVYDREETREGRDFTQDLRVEMNDRSGSGLSGVLGAFYGDFGQDSEGGIYYDYFGTTYPIQVGESGHETRTKAVYTDLRYAVYGDWSLIGGLRYQQDRVRNYSDMYGISKTTLSPYTTVYDHEGEFDVLLPKYGLLYQINPMHSIAATASRGYRQGFAENIIGTPGKNLVDPEFVWTYELAYRHVSEDKRFNFGANLFYNTYKDQQISIVNPDFPPYVNTFNVGESVSYGAELEGRYHFDNGLKVFGSIGLLKTEFKDLAEGASNASGTNWNGNEFHEAPNLTLGFGGSYRHTSGLFASVDASYTGEYYTNTGDIDNTDAVEIKDRFIANAKIGYSYQYATLDQSISLYVKNLFDKQYLTGQSSATRASIGDGRVLGVELLVKF